MSSFTFAIKLVTTFGGENVDEDQSKVKSKSPIAEVFQNYNLGKGRIWNEDVM